MSLRFTPRAAADLEAIHTYIADDNPDAATSVVERIVRSARMLERFPYMGHEGVVAGTLEHTVPGIPYVIVYRVEGGDGDEVVVVSIYHGRQDRGA